MAFIHIAGNTYELIIENRNGWNTEAFRNRYSEVLERYDYIVGDWGYNQLRLKGFFKDGHQKATKDSTYSYVTDYINEYCNFGCAYFLLEKKQSDETEQIPEDVIFIEESEYVRPLPVYTSKDKDAKDSKDSKDSKDKTKVAALSEGQSSYDKDGGRQKRAPQREKAQDGSNENGQEKQRSRQNNQRSRNQQRHQAKALQDIEKASDVELEQKKDGKSKRKDHFYRKSNRSHDKKPKVNKVQTEQMSSSSK